MPANVTFKAAATEHILTCHITDGSEFLTAHKLAYQALKAYTHRGVNNPFKGTPLNFIAKMVPNVASNVLNLTRDSSVAVRNALKEYIQNDDILNGYAVDLTVNHEKVITYMEVRKL